MNGAAHTKGAEGPTGSLAHFVSHWEQPGSIRDPVVHGNVSTVAPLLQAIAMIS